MKIPRTLAPCASWTLVSVDAMCASHEPQNRYPCSLPFGW